MNEGVSGWMGGKEGEREVGEGREGRRKGRRKLAGKDS